MVQLTNEHQPNITNEQRWRAQLADEARTSLALTARQQHEEEDSYLFQINPGERALLVARHQQERKDLVQQQRAQRIAMRKE